MAPSQSERSVCISSIALNVRPQFDKTVDRIVFQSKSGSFKKETSVQVLPGHRHEEIFDPVLNLSPLDRLSVSVQYKSRWCGRRALSFTMEVSDVVTKAHDDADGKKTYFKFRRNVELVIVVSRYSAVSGSSARGAPLPPTTVDNPLPPTTEDTQDAPLPITDEIRNICPRFRLLIIGNTGVGKSTLIHKVFGVQDVDVSESSRGKADINSEFVAAENGFFVLHDSVGLEAGDSKNFNTIKTFISDRKRKENLMDRLHAVWVCLTVPFAEGRLLEAGMEDFLRERKKILGNIPVVVVLTKLDLLDNSLYMTLREQGIEVKTMEEARPLLEPRRSEFIDEFCAQPLRRVAGGDIRHVAVSTRPRYGLEQTVPELVKTTTSEIERYIKADLSRSTAAEASIERTAQLYIAGMAQRASIETKVDLTIALGKKRYWTNLGASLRFSGERVKEYLLGIHRDIIQVWNLNDPEMALQSDEFKGALLDTAGLGVREVRDLETILGSVAPLVSALAPMVNDLIGVVISLPIAATTILTGFLHEAYKTSQAIVKRFMAYIVDLVYVMKVLFIVAPQRAITSQDVALALEVYKRLTYRNRVHLEIQDFSTTFAIFPGARNTVLEKVEALIRRYDITDKEVSRLRGKLNTPSSSS